MDYFHSEKYSVFPKGYLNQRDGDTARGISHESERL